MGNIVHFSRSILFVPDYPILPQIKIHTPRITANLYFKFHTNPLSGSQAKIHIFKMAAVFQKKV